MTNDEGMTNDRMTESLNYESALNWANQYTMEIRTYRAESVHEALQMVREELGPDAIVLRTREVRAGGLWGLIRGDRCTELTASTDLPALEPWLRPSGAMDREST